MASPADIACVAWELLRTLPLTGDRDGLDILLKLLRNDIKLYRPQAGKAKEKAE